MIPRLLIPLALALLFTSCATRPGAGRSPSQIAERTAFWSPHLLYSHRSPYPKLYVEVDAVQGAAPAQSHLDALRRFLEKHCDKPGGVRVVRSDTISATTARDRTAEAVALSYIDGPPDRSSAFIYVLYWDSDLMVGDKTNPETTLLPYPCSIFIDRRYDPLGQFSKYGDLVLSHEAAHVIGLTRNPHHGDGVHCTNDNCLMNAAIMFNFWDVINDRDPQHQREFCADCTADLRRNRSIAPARNLRFTNGPYFVRSEANYHVVSLPGFIYVHFGPLAALDLRDLSSDARNTAAQLSEPDEVHASSSRLTDLDLARRLVPELKADPYAAVREIGTELERQLP